MIIIVHVIFFTAIYFLIKSLERYEISENISTSNIVSLFCTPMNWLLIDTDTRIHTCIWNYLWLVIFSVRFLFCSDAIPNFLSVLFIRAWRTPTHDVWGREGGRCTGLHESLKICCGQRDRVFGALVTLTYSSPCWFDAPMTRTEHFLKCSL